MVEMPEPGPVEDRLWKANLPDGSGRDGLSAGGWVFQDGPPRRLLEDADADLDLGVLRRGVPDDGRDP